MDETLFITDDLMDFLVTSMMPRHLMVRRANDADTGPSLKKLYHENTPSEGNQSRHGGCSSSLESCPDVWPRSTEGDVWMTLGVPCSGQRYSELNDDFVDVATGKTAGDESFIQKAQRCQLYFKDDGISGGDCGKLSEIVNNGGSSAMTLQNPDEKPGLTSKYSRSVSQSFKNCRSDNASPSYRILGVKKNFLHRSGSIGCSRSENGSLGCSKSQSSSPSKKCQFHRALRPIDRNSPSPKSNVRHTIPENFPSKRTPKCHSGIRDENTAPVTAPASAIVDASSSPQKKPSFNISRTALPKSSRLSVAFRGRRSVPDDLKDVSPVGMNNLIITNDILRSIPDLISSSLLSPEEAGEELTHWAQDGLFANEENSGNATKHFNSNALLVSEDLNDPLGSAASSRKSQDGDMDRHPLSVESPLHDGAYLEAVKILEEAVVLQHKENSDGEDDDSKDRAVDKDSTVTKESAADHRSSASASEQVMLPQVSSASEQVMLPKVSSASEQVMLPKVSSASEQVMLPKVSSEPSSFPSSSSDLLAGHEDITPVSSPSPNNEEEMDSLDQRSASVEIDVVGDLPPKRTSGSCLDSGIVSDFSCCDNTAAQQNDQVSLDDCGPHDLSNRAARSSTPPDSNLTAAPADSLVTPDRQYSIKPLYSSTPVSSAWPTWSQQLSATDIMYYQQPHLYPYINNITARSTLTLMPPTSILNQHLNITTPRYPLHYGFDYRVYSSMLAPLDFGRINPAQFSPLSLSSPLNLPLNLSNRRSFQIPLSESTASATATSSSFDSPAQSIFIRDTSQSQNVPAHSLLSSGMNGSQNVPACAHNLAPQHSLGLYEKQNSHGSDFMMTAPQEYPLNMSLSACRQDTNSEGASSNEEPSEAKKRRISRKIKNQAMPLQLLKDSEIQNKANMRAKANQNCQPVFESAHDQPVKGVTLGQPPVGAEPVSSFAKTKERLDAGDRRAGRASKRCKENVYKGEHEAAKQRNKPELYGEHEITELQVAFYQCPERDLFCDSNLRFQIPKIPDTSEGQANLRQALLRLFSKSNLPPVPSALKHSVHALSQYPFMQHLFSLHAQGVDLDALKFGAYGLALENIRLVELGEKKFNEILDSMSYLGDDGLFHCLVKNEKTGAMCGHVAHEIGKIRRHSKNHYPDKKWVCVFCRVQMCDMTDLERHTAIHTELKPFECPQCSKKFCQKVTLTQHMNKGHGQQLTKWDAKSSYICRQDGYSFSKGEELACARHLRQHHSQTDYIKRKKMKKWPFSCMTEDMIEQIEGEH